MTSIASPFAVDSLPPTSFARGKQAAGLMRTGQQGNSAMEMKRFSKRQNSTGFYTDAEKIAAAHLPRTAPVPGYTGFYQGMNCDYGVSKAFGLPMQVMQIPKTPPLAPEEDLSIGAGYGPNGKHKLGATSLYAGKGYAERTQMMQQLQRRRITGEGKRAPFDFVPGDGLVQECHIHTDSVYHQFPQTETRMAYMPDASTVSLPGRLRRPKGMARKGFAPPVPAAADAPGTAKYSIFNLPTLSQVTQRKTQVTRV